MKLFLFLDDWLLDGTKDIVRRWGVPKLDPDAPAMPNMMQPCDIHQDPKTGQFFHWYRRWELLDKADSTTQEKTDLEGDLTQHKGKTVLKLFCVAKSNDGVHWKDVEDHPGPRNPLAKCQSSIDAKLANGEPVVLNNVYYDPYDPDETRRYKSITGRGYLMVSPDGFRWKQAEGIRPFDVPAGSDTYNHIRFNPVTGCYQVIHRPANLDRRVAMVESEDLKIWTKPRIILQPDALDEPHLQFYGMPTFWYEDMWIGLLYRYSVPVWETVRRNKMLGVVVPELAYSYNGQYWLRANRKPFIQRLNPGEWGYGSIYTTSVYCDRENNILRFYSAGYRIEHGPGPEILEPLSKGESFSAMIQHTLRKDGFCWLEPVGENGELWTRGLIPQDDELTINVQAPEGEVRVQLTDETRRPLEGFSFEECVPIKGDHFSAKPRWKNATLKKVIGRWCRLEFHLRAARLYAFRWNCNLHYGVEPTERL